VQSEYETAHAELTKRKEKLLACDKSIADLMAERDKLTRELTDNEVERKKLEHKIFRYHKDKKDAAKFVEHLEQKYVWLATEKQ
jgi:chromosome segregation ATPase